MSHFLRHWHAVSQFLRVVSHFVSLGSLLNDRKWDMAMRPVRMGGRLPALSQFLPALSQFLPALSHFLRVASRFLRGVSHFLSLGGRRDARKWDMVVKLRHVSRFLGGGVPLCVAGRATEQQKVGRGWKRGRGGADDGCRGIR
ncbi:hypothetical protein GCM10010462_20840 [Microbacterium dextranolyticum]|uniref:Uncharacterized protein n=1 Tax=Microbacterium dextranolyticum TaxID=36806 RepID=A0A9W6HK67_9MICO|nr:hypothetical protein GCM10017591_05390 [Microbacterium dextranolyticum]